MANEEEKKEKSRVSIPVAAAAGTIAVLYGIYRFGFYSPLTRQNVGPGNLLPATTPEQEKLNNELIERMALKPFESVSTFSYDDLSLFGRYYHTADNAPLAILFHGYRGDPGKDYCCAADICFSLGYNVLLVFERAHGCSGGNTITFGVKERYDVLSWVNYAVKRFGKDVKIILGGISMGGGTVLMSSDLNLPHNVKGIVADCPFSSPSEVIVQFGRARRIPGIITYPLTALSTRLFGGFSLGSTDAVTAVNKAQVPILILHGEADTHVPPEMSLKIYEANSELIERHTFPGAGHADFYLREP